MSHIITTISIRGMIISNTTRPVIVQIMKNYIEIGKFFFFIENRVLLCYQSFWVFVINK